MLFQTTFEIILVTSSIAILAITGFPGGMKVPILVIAGYIVRILLREAMKRGNGPGNKHFVAGSKDFSAGSKDIYAGSKHFVGGSKCFYARSKYLVPGSNFSLTRSKHFISGSNMFSL